MDLVLPGAGVDNNDSNFINLISSITDTKLYVLVVTLLSRENQKLSKLLSKRLERSVYWN